VVAGLGTLFVNPKVTMLFIVIVLVSIVGAVALDPADTVAEARISGRTTVFEDLETVFTRPAPSVVFPATPVVVDLASVVDFAFAPWTVTTPRGGACWAVAVVLEAMVNVTVLMTLAAPYPGMPPVQGSTSVIVTVCIAIAAI